jgi:guanine nucleotide-binding protein subunit beta-2-like 1 protein
MTDSQQYKLEYRGFLKGHGGWVTTMKVGEHVIDGQSKEFLISGSRDKSLMIWDIEEKNETDEDKEWGKPRKVLKGHSHFIQEVCLATEGRYALSASWDGTLRLWDLLKGKTTQRFVSHTRDVLTVDMSPDNRQIASGGRDKALKIWNTVGQCKFTVEENAHTDWVSAVKFYHDTKTPIVVSASWDRTIKVWDNNTMSLMHTFHGHKAQINSLDIPPNAEYLASGGKDGIAMIWNLVEGSAISQTETDSPINCVLFAKKMYWLIIGTEAGIQVFDLPGNKTLDKYEAEPQDSTAGKKQQQKVQCTSLAWNASGQLLFSGWSDNLIRVLKIVVNNKE